MSSHMNIELVDVVLLGRMDSDFRRRQSENEPSVADVDVRQRKHIAEKCAVGVRVRAGDDRMCAANHGPSKRRSISTASCDGARFVRARTFRTGVTFSRDRNLEREAVIEERAVLRDALQRSLGQAH
jgi:hypothetical protein